MGRDVTQAAFSRDDRVRYREKLHRCLDVLTQMLVEVQFDGDLPRTGLEIEINLLDGQARPAMCNGEIIAELADPTYQTELGQFNLEVNISPRLIERDGLEQYEREILNSLHHADKRASRLGAQLVLIGILPTVAKEHTVAQYLSANPRFRILNDEMSAARGGAFQLDIRGSEHLRTGNDSIAAEAACTSAQFHLQVAPDHFARYWNAAQVIAGVQVALGANSPFLYGRRLWAETRIALFEQSTDIRPDELRAQGVRPRVWFGERWISSVAELFEENIRYFAPLLPICEEEDPAKILAAGGVPRLGELKLHNGTIYRWNRPVYDVQDGRPHLRIENRVLPSGPTVADMLANAAFYYGLLRALAEEERPIWTRMTFPSAEENLRVAAKDGIGARLWWPAFGEIPVADLVLTTLLPLAHSGLDALGVNPGVRDRLLGIIEGRCRTGTNGAVWQTEMVRMLEGRHNLSRSAAIRKMLDRYRDGLYHNEPVHRWPLG